MYRPSAPIAHITPPTVAYPYSDQYNDHEIVPYSVNIDWAELMKFTLPFIISGIISGIVVSVATTYFNHKVFKIKR